MVDSCRSRATCIGHWVFFEETMFWWQLHSTSSLGVPGRTADRRWFQVCNDHRHGDLSGIVLANSDRGSIWFPPASRGYQFIYMEDFRNLLTTFAEKGLLEKTFCRYFLELFPNKKSPCESCGSPYKMICSTHFLRSRTACHRCNQPPGQFLAGKSLHQNATAKMKPCTCCFTTKRVRQKLCAVQDREMIWDV